MFQSPTRHVRWNSLERHPDLPSRLHLSWFSLTSRFRAHDLASKKKVAPWHLLGAPWHVLEGGEGGGKDEWNHLLKQQLDVFEGDDWAPKTGLSFVKYLRVQL